MCPTIVGRQARWPRRKEVMSSFPVGGVLRIFFLNVRHRSCARGTWHSILVYRDPGVCGRYDRAHGRSHV